MLFISRSEINRMKKNIIDEELGTTEFDIFENEHCYEDWQVIEDVKEKQYEEVKNDILAAEWQ